MLSTDHSPYANGHSKFDDAFEALRASYYKRMRNDRASLLAIHAELLHGATELTSVYYTIRMLAHRIGGAAAIFECPGSAAAAATLERSALQAIESNTKEAREGVIRALESLLGSIAEPRPDNTLAL